jgi:hypothetical protein
MMQRLARAQVRPIEVEAAAGARKPATVSEPLAAA